MSTWSKDRFSCKGHDMIDLGERSDIWSTAKRSCLAVIVRDTPQLGRLDLGGQIKAHRTIVHDRRRLVVGAITALYSAGSAQHSGRLAEQVR
jgi:hypothetical protein